MLTILSLRECPVRLCLILLQCPISFQIDHVTTRNAGMAIWYCWILGYVWFIQINMYPCSIIYRCWRFLSHSCPVTIFCQIRSSTQPLQYFPDANNQASSRLRGFAIGNPFSKPKKLLKLSGSQCSGPNHPKRKKIMHSRTLTYRNIRRSR